MKTNEKGGMSSQSADTHSHMDRQNTQRGQRKTGKRQSRERKDGV